MTYWSRVNKNFLMKGILVVTIILTCSRARTSRTIRREDVRTFLVVNRYVSTIKLNQRPRSHHPLRRIERRRPIATVERWYMPRKRVGRKLLTWKRRRSSLKGMWQLCDWPVSQPTHLLPMSEFINCCMLRCRRMNGLLTSVALIIWWRMLLCSLR